MASMDIVCILVYLWTLTRRNVAEFNRRPSRASIETQTEPRRGLGSGQPFVRPEYPVKQ